MMSESPDLEVSELQGGGVLGHDLAGLLESLACLLLPLGRNNLGRRIHLIPVEICTLPWPWPPWQPQPLLPLLSVAESEA